MFEVGRLSRYDLNRVCWVDIIAKAESSQEDGTFQATSTKSAFVVLTNMTNLITSDDLFRSLALVYKSNSVQTE